MNTRFPSRLLLVAAVAAVPLLAACGDDDEATPVDADALEGRTFVATEFTPDGIVDGSEIAVTFEDGAVIVMAGCNTQRGGYSIADGVLSVDPMMSTMMACDEALMAQDTSLATFFSSSPSIALDGDVLTVSGGDTELTLSAS